MKLIVGNAWGQSDLYRKDGKAFYTFKGVRNGVTIIAHFSKTRYIWCGYISSTIISTENENAMDDQEKKVAKEKERVPVSNQEKKVADEDIIFALESVFPDASGVFFGNYQKLKKCVAEAIFVLDTNVLLMPYSLGNESIKEIQRVYKELIDKKKLFIPERVAREYAKNRSKKIADIYVAISRMKVGPAEPKCTYPIVNDLQEKGCVDKAFEKFKDSKAKYFEAIDNLLGQIRGWEWNDPVDIIYSELFCRNVMCSHNLSNADLVKDLARRFKIKQPPGYKDLSKDDGGVGDLAIWLSILQLGKDKKKHLIFVSEDTKPDWWQNSNGSGFLPRYELIDEYRGGHLEAKRFILSTFRSYFSCLMHPRKRLKRRRPLNN